MADRRPLVNVAGQLQEMPSGDKVPVTALATGTPTGDKFVRDDGVLANPVKAEGVIHENGVTISANYTLTTGKNGLSVGPITVNSGVSVTVPSGQRWVVL